MPQQASEQAGAERRVFLILWIAMLGAVVMYFVVMRLVPPPAPRDNPSLLAGLIVLAAALVAVSFAVRNRLLERARKAGRPELRRLGVILGLVLCDAAALLAVVAWLLTGSRQSYYPWITGFAGVLFHFPAREV